jgi:hypothetical protein
MAVAAIFLLTVLGAGPALAAEPSSGSVDGDDASASWNGAWFREAVAPDPGACDLETDPQDALCDHYLLTVDVEDTFWQTRDGAIAVGIVWPRAKDDFDLYVFEAEGDRLWASTADTGSAERLRIDEPVGDYEVRVIPVEVENSGYLGWASLSSKEVPPDEGSEPSGDGSAGGSGGEGTTTQGDAGTGGHPVGSVSTSDDPSAFADAPYGSRTFDSTSTSNADTSTVAPTTPAPEPVIPDPAVSVPDTMFEAAPVEVAPTATATARFPEAAWIVLALAVLALALTGLAVFERFPDDAVERPGRGSRARLRPGASPGWASVAPSRRRPGRWPVDRRFVLWWG